MLNHMITYSKQRSRLSFLRLARTLQTPIATTITNIVVIITATVVLFYVAIVASMSRSSEDGRDIVSALRVGHISIFARAINRGRGG